MIFMLAQASFSGLQGASKGLQRGFKGLQGASRGFKGFKVKGLEGARRRLEMLEVGLKAA
jgi:hypothetical protein